jgi:hypothetical protein
VASLLYADSMTVDWDRWMIAISRVLDPWRSAKTLKARLIESRVKIILLSGNTPVGGFIFLERWWQVGDLSYFHT